MAKLHGRGINIKIQTYLHQFPKESQQINSYLRTYYIYIIYLIQPQNLNTSRHNILQATNIFLGNQPCSAMNKFNAFE